MVQVREARYVLVLKPKGAQLRLLLADSPDVRRISDTVCWI